MRNLMIIFRFLCFQSYLGGSMPTRDAPQVVQIGSSKNIDTLDDYFS